MDTSDERILTTHTGSLPRPRGLLKALGLGTDEAPAGPDEQERLLRTAIADIVRQQVEVGVDVVSDGELSKSGYSTYITERMSGFGGHSAPLSRQKDAEDFPEWGVPFLAAIEGSLSVPACIGEVRYVDTAPLLRDVANQQSAMEQSGAREGFVSTASPGVIAMFQENQHYPDHETYVHALADAMKTEYDAIHEAGLVLQLDCPDLAAGHHVQFPDMPLDAWKTTIAMHVEALNEATRDIPSDRMRMHLCWGNYPGPHNHDVPLSEILDIVLRARPAAISVEAANPRHEHEWELFDRVKLPDDKVLIPGVIDSKSTYIEHPELVAQRLVRYANLVGRERVLAGTDCGFGTFALFSPIPPSIVSAKLAAMAEGARLASRQLWR
jgi:5-methyltetrahydropteroyltriglutamate--homocysteine methyltransferase